MVKCMVKFNTAHKYHQMCREKSIPSHLLIKDLSPQIYMMNYRTAKMIIIINNAFFSLPKKSAEIYPEREKGRENSQYKA
jgi:hypothetical protein